MPDPSRDHRPGGGARHGGAPGGWAPRRAGMRGAGGRRRLRASSAAAPPGVGTAGLQPPGPRLLPLQRGPPGRAALPPPRDAAYLRPGARAAGATAAARGDSAARGRGRADAPARAAEPPPGRCPAHAAGARAGAELEPRRCRRGAALRGDHNSHNAARGGAGPARGAGAPAGIPTPTRVFAGPAQVTRGRALAARPGGFCRSGRFPLQPNQGFIRSRALTHSLRLCLGASVSPPLAPQPARAPWVSPASVSSFQSLSLSLPHLSCFPASRPNILLPLRLINIHS